MESLQAADALDDLCFEHLLRLAAGILHRQAIAHNRRTTFDSQHMSHCLSKLPDHLQHRVFESVTTGACATGNALQMLLDFLPVSHHAAVLAATITYDKSLNAESDGESLSIVDALPLLPSLPLPILSLSLGCRPK